MFALTGEVTTAFVAGMIAGCIVTLMLAFLFAMLSMAKDDEP